MSKVYYLNIEFEEEKAFKNINTLSKELKKYCEENKKNFVGISKTFLYRKMKDSDFYENSARNFTITKINIEHHKEEEEEEIKNEFSENEGGEDFSEDDEGYLDHGNYIEITK